MILLEAGTSHEFLMKIVFYIGSIDLAKLRATKGVSSSYDIRNRAKIFKFSIKRKRKKKAILSIDSPSCQPYHRDALQ